MAHRSRHFLADDSRLQVTAQDSKFRPMSQGNDMAQSPAYDSDDNSVGCRYSIHNFEASEKSIHVRLKQNGVRFILLISPENFRNSPSQSRRFQAIWQKIRDYDTRLPEVWDYVQDAIEPFESILDEIAPFTSPEGKLTLADLDKGRFYDLTLEAVDDQLRSGSVKESLLSDGDDDDDDSLPPEDSFCFARNLNTPFPIFGMGDVEISYENPKLVYKLEPSHVIVNGQRCYFKRCRFPDIAAAEVAKHVKIFNAKLSTTELRCVRLFGLVEEKDGYLHGLLYHFIDEYMTLAFAVKDKAFHRLAKEDFLHKWADQIQSTLKKLHEIGVIWGDVKADNVLVDTDYNAWIIDLEGGTTRGWVDKEHQNTLQGDAQGMEKLMDFIFNDDSPLRIDEPAPWDEAEDEGGDGDGK